VHPDFNLESEAESKRYYFCFGNNTYMFHSMIYFGPSRCTVETHIKEGLCSRALLDSQENGGAQQKHVLEAIKDGI
jgi:hypothetical protein